MKTNIDMEKNTIPVVTPKYGIGSLFRVTLDSESNDFYENSIVVLGYHPVTDQFFLLDLEDGILCGCDDTGPLFNSNPNKEFTLREIETSFDVRLEYIKEIKVAT